MSLVNQNWIGLDGEPVTGRIPPRLRIMNGVQPNQQQMGMIAHHYKLLTYTTKVSVAPFLIQERHLTDGTRIRMVSNHGTDTVMVWPTRVNGDVPQVPCGIYITLQEVEFDGSQVRNPKWKKTRGTLLPAALYPNDRGAVEWGWVKEDTVMGGILVVIDGEKELDEDAYKKGRVKFYRAPRISMGAPWTTLTDRNLRKGRPVAWFTGATNIITLFNTGAGSYVNVSGTLANVKDHYTVDFFTTGSLNGTAFVLKVSENTYTLYAFKIREGAENPLEEVATATKGPDDEVAQFGYDFKTESESDPQFITVTYTTTGKLYAEEVTSSYTVVVRTDLKTGEREISGSIELGIKEKLPDPGHPELTQSQTYSVEYHPVPVINETVFATTSSRTYEMVQTFPGSYSRDPWTEAPVYTAGRVITAKRLLRSYGPISAELTVTSLDSDRTDVHYSDSGAPYPEFGTTSFDSSAILGPFTEERNVGTIEKAFISAEYNAGYTATTYRTTVRGVRTTANVSGTVAQVFESAKLFGSGPNEEDNIYAETSISYESQGATPIPVARSAPGNDGTVNKRVRELSAKAEWERFRVGTFKEFDLSAEVINGEGEAGAKNITYSLRGYGQKDPVVFVDDVLALFPNGLDVARRSGGATIATSGQSFFAKHTVFGISGERLIDGTLMNMALPYLAYMETTSAQKKYLDRSSDPTPFDITIADSYTAAEYTSTFGVPAHVLQNDGVNVINIVTSFGGWDFDAFASAPTGTVWTTEIFEGLASGLVSDWYPRVYHDPRNSTFIVQCGFIGKEEINADTNKYAGALRLYVGNKISATPLEPLINAWIEDIKYEDEGHQIAYGGLTYEPGDLMIDFDEELPSPRSSPLL